VNIDEAKDEALRFCNPLHSFAIKLLHDCHFVDVFIDDDTTDNEVRNGRIRFGVKSLFSHDIDYLKDMVDYIERRHGYLRCGDPILLQTYPTGLNQTTVYWEISLCWHATLQEGDPVLFGRDV
jgi:hypothetical protein